MFSDTTPDTITSDTTATTAPDTPSAGLTPRGGAWLRVLLIALVTLGVLGAATTPARAQFAQTQKLTDLLIGLIAEDEEFGTSVSISGDRALVGFPGHDAGGDRAGRAAIFERQTDGTWRRTQRLSASDRSAGDEFGYSVSVSGDRLIVGAPFNGAGAAYLFERQADGSWTQTAKLTASDGGAGDRFGTSVSISGDRAAVGAPFDDGRGSNSGAAYMFELDGGTWTQDEKLTPSNGFGGPSTARDEFGTSVSISGERVLVGAPFGERNDGTPSGVARVYVLQTRGFTPGWNQTDKLVPSDRAAGAGDRFGYSVSINGDRALVGSPNTRSIFGSDRAGAAYVYGRDSFGSWTQDQKLTPPEGFTGPSAAGDRFGTSVSISGNRALVGVPFDDDDADNAGAVYVYERRTSGSWRRAQKLTASSGGAGDEFGTSVSISGDRALVGVPFDDENADNAGAAYVYGPNRPPVAKDDQATTPAGTSVAIDVLANDTDPNPGQTLRVGSVGTLDAPQSGTVTINYFAGTVTYTPDGSFNVDSFSYTVSDGAGGTDTGTVTVLEDAALTFHVDASRGSDLNTGRSWSDAFATLQKALSVATGDDQIWIAAGTYTPGSRRGDSFRVTGAQDGLQIYGGFAGTETSPGQRQPGSETILSGDIDGNGGLSGNSYHVLVFDGGDRIGPDVAADVTAATVLDGVTVTGGNTKRVSIPEASGGGLYCDGRGSGNACSPTLTGVTFTGNTSYFGGGAIYNDGSFGGTSSPQITNATFTGNSTTIYGGAIFNSGESDGESSPQITNATFTGNSARFFGGAIYNSSRSSGTSSPQITNATFTGNSASSRGGAIYNDGNFEGASAPQVTNTILWGNGSDEIFNDEATPTLTHTLIEGGCPSGADCPGPILNADPLFADAGAPAGPDGVFATADDGLRLQAGSPAIDAGNDAAVPSGVTTDLAGADRIQGGTVDLGAYEGAAASSNQPPVAEDDAATTPAGTAVTIDVLANDTDPNAGQPLSVASVGTVTAPQSGTATLNADSTITYTSNDGFTGADSFSYTLSDGAGGTDIGEVTVTVLGACTITQLTESDVYGGPAGLGRIDLTFENSDGVAEVAFTKFENFNLVGGTVSPAPTNTGTTSAGGPLLTFASGPDFDGAPQAVTLTLQQADAAVNTSTYFAVASSVCPNPEQDPDEDGLLQTDFDPPVGFEAVVPEALRFAAPYPNPLAGGTATFRVGLPESERVTLAIYDVMGRRVATVADRALAAGTHDLRWDGRGRSGAPVASGLYLARLTAGSTTQIHRLTVVR